MAYGSAGASAAAAAAEQRRAWHEEEEGMTFYSAQDLAGEWEFKIVRANTGVFRNPAELEKLVKEEALAGWILLEKFDDSRIRFKRRMSERQKDSRLPPGVDPYRTHYGMGSAMYTTLVVGVVLGATLVFTVFLFAFIALFLR